MRKPRISEAEWSVMEVLWSGEGSLTASDIIDALDRRGWAPNTIRTLLARLVRKRVVAARKMGGRHTYRAVIPRAEYVRVESESFLQRVFQGSVQPLLLHLVDHHRLSDREIEELKLILQRRKRP